jgi:hypothetical protein
MSSDTESNGVRDATIEVEPSDRLAGREVLPVIVGTGVVARGVELRNQLK